MATFKELLRSITSLNLAASGNSALDAVDAIKIVPAANAAAANVLTLTNASMGQATALTIPDPKAAAANLVVSTAAGTATPTGHVNDSSAVVVASTTHTQAGATAILTDMAGVTTNNASDAVVLPASAVGLAITVVNLSASNAMQVYAAGSDTINGTAGSTGVSQAAAAVTIYFCFQPGKYVTK